MSIEHYPKWFVVKPILNPHKVLSQPRPPRPMSLRPLGFQNHIRPSQAGLKVLFIPENLVGAKIYYRTCPQRLDISFGILGWYNFDLDVQPLKNFPFHIFCQTQIGPPAGFTNFDGPQKLIELLLFFLPLTVREV